MHCVCVHSSCSQETALQLRSEPARTSSSGWRLRFPCNGVIQEQQKDVKCYFTAREKGNKASRVRVKAQIQRRRAGRRVRYWKNSPHAPMANVTTVNKCRTRATQKPQTQHVARNISHSSSCEQKREAKQSKTGTKG